MYLKLLLGAGLRLAVVGQSKVGTWVKTVSARTLCRGSGGGKSQSTQIITDNCARKEALLGTKMIDEWHAGKVSHVRKPKPVDFKIYCDESCHLEHDGNDAMVFGALCCDAPAVEPIVRAVKELRNRFVYHNEIKWSKLIAKQLPFYLELIDLFLGSGGLRFKATVVKNKSLLDHTQYNGGSHGTFYYKMAFYTLRDFLDKEKVYRIHLDYMDTQGNQRTQKLIEILGAAKPSVTISAQTIRSHESQLIQLCDLLIGAMSYSKRFDAQKRSATKARIIDHLENKLGRVLPDSTPPWEDKFNIFVFSPRKAA